MGTWNANCNYNNSYNINSAGKLLILITYACYGIDNNWNSAGISTTIKVNNALLNESTTITSAYTKLSYYTTNVNASSTLNINANFNKVSSSMSIIVFIL